MTFCPVRLFFAMKQAMTPQLPTYTQGVGSNAQQRGMGEGVRMKMKMRVGARDAYDFDYLREEGVVNRRKEEFKNGSCLDQERGRPLSFAAFVP